MIIGISSPDRNDQIIPKLTGFRRTFSTFCFVTAYKMMYETSGGSSNFNTNTGGSKQEDQTGRKSFRIILLRIRLNRM